jgi:hypothetical protein
MQARRPPKAADGTKKKGRSLIARRPKSREETPKEGMRHHCRTAIFAECSAQNQAKLSSY